MFSKKKNVRITRPKEIGEVYLRNDLGCGIVGCSVCGTAAHEGYTPVIDSTQPIMIPDTNILLHNINFLEDPRMKNIVFLGTTLNETQNRNRAVYARLSKLLGQEKQCFMFANSNHEATSCVKMEDESANDFNDRCIRVATIWYARHCQVTFPNVKVCLVSHDMALHAAWNNLADKAGNCMLLADFVAGMENSEVLLEKIEFSVPDGMKESASGPLFTPHLQLEELEQGIFNGTLLKGKLRVSESSCFFGEIRGKWNRGFERCIVAGKRNLNRAIHDDIVAVRVFPIEEWRLPGKKNDDLGGLTESEALRIGLTPCGIVVGIVEMKRRPYCGSIDEDEVERALGVSGQVSVLFQPKSNRIPRIRIQTRNLLELRDKRLTVVIDDWPLHCSAPVGHFIQVLGTIGDKDTEAQVILMEHDVPHYDFSQAVYDCLPKGEWKVEDEEVRKRLDLRQLCIVSVDPLGCRDIDDALHARVLEGGHIEVGVHIADVTHFLKEHTPMDDEAAKRSTSVYLVDRRINMLPQLLTENLCSIVGSEDRYAFSIIWEFDSKFNVVRDWFGKTIIRSRAALYYGDAQHMIDDEDDHSEIACSLRLLMKLSRWMKAQRSAEGALFLASQEFKFKIDNDHVNPTDMCFYQNFEANSMVEEWMLFANAAAAKRIYATFPRWTLLRRHESPDESSFDPLNEALMKKIGVKLDPSSSLKLNQTLDLAVDPNDSFFNKLVRILTTRCLRQAQYFSSAEVPYASFAHFGLAMPIYTHFTSPIRRYADVVVHRQLAAALQIEQVSTVHMDAQQMDEMASNLNYRHEQAQKAGRDSQNLYTGFYLRQFEKGEIPVEPGYVVKVNETHYFILVPKYGQETKVAREEVDRELLLLQKVEVKIELRREGDALRTRLIYTVLSEKQNEEPSSKKMRPEDAMP